jgi:hypothetical protein
MRHSIFRLYFLCGLSMTILTNCGPTVKVEAPEKPIVVNLNVNIEHSLKVKIEKDLDEVIRKNPDIF